MENNKIVQNEIENNSNFYTDTRTKVNQRIIDNKTIVFTSEKLAQIYAKKIKSYFYRIYIERKVSKTHYSTTLFYGYAVPK